MALFEQGPQRIPSTLLKDRYGWPPFSILNTISWDWQRRVDDWEKVIGDSTLGREVGSNNATPRNTFSARGKEAKAVQSISEFDPYLAELMYRWFSRPGDKILDPFSGGIVRGAVAEILGRQYHGIDLSYTQVKSNYEQNRILLDKYTDIAGNANWYDGDAEEVQDIFPQDFDMVLTCPPYYNLEKYSDSPKDLSNLTTYSDFLYKYARILHKTVTKLKSDSFFVIVVSEVRGSDHNLDESYYVGLVPDTINILRGEGLHYYNEIILENNIGSLPIRAPKYFNRSRKIGRHHQNVLVFFKGDISHIEGKFSPVEIV